MSAPDESELEARCVAGEAGAIEEAVALLAAEHAYTRARASEMLARAPEAVLAVRVAPVLAAGFPSPLWWRVLALFAESEGRLPGGESMGDAVSAAIRGSADEDPDAIFHCLHALSASAIPGRAELATRWIRHADTEVAVRAALVIAEERRLFEDELARLADVRGEDRLHALVVRVAQGQRGALDELVRAVPSAGPFAYHALETIETHGGAEVLPALRALWDRHLFAGHVEARAAGAASALGDASATERLRRLTRALRRATRGVAWAELARTGTAADLDRVADLLRSRRPEAAFVASELWRRDDEAARDLALVALRQGDADVRTAICETVGRWSPDERLTSELRSLTNDPDPGVREAASEVLGGLVAPPGPARPTPAGTEPRLP